jgi:hypothetical protein
LALGWGLAEAVGFFDHAVEHTADFGALVHKRLNLFCGEVVAVLSAEEPMFGFVLFTDGIGEFADKMFFVAAFAPRLGNLCPNRTRGTPNLIGQRVNFLFRKML